MKSGRRLKGSSEPNSNRTRAGPLESQKAGVDGGCILSSAEQTTPFSTLNGLERAFTGEAYSEGGHDFFWLCNFILCLTKDGVRELARNVPVTMLLWRRPDSTATATATASTAGTTSSTSSASTSNRGSTASDGAARKRRRLPTTNSSGGSSSSSRVGKRGLPVVAALALEEARRSVRAGDRMGQKEIVKMLQKHARTWYHDAHEGGGE